MAVVLWLWLTTLWCCGYGLQPVVKPWTAHDGSKVAGFNVQSSADSGFADALTVLTPTGQRRQRLQRSAPASTDRQQ